MKEGQEIVRLADQSVAQKILLKSNALIIRGNITLDEWRRGGNGIRRVGNSWQLLFGDALNYGDDNFEEFSQVVEEFIEGDISIRTIQKYMYVCRRIPPDRRRDVSYSHHEEVARVDDDEKMYQFLDIAERDKLPVKGEGSLRELVDTFLGKTPPALTLEKFLNSIDKKLDEAEKKLSEGKYHSAMDEVRNKINARIGPEKCSCGNREKPEQKEEKEVKVNSDFFDKHGIKVGEK